MTCMAERCTLNTPPQSHSHAMEERLRRSSKVLDGLPRPIALLPDRLGRASQTCSRSSIPDVRECSTFSRCSILECSRMFRTISIFRFGCSRISRAELALRLALDTSAADASTSPTQLKPIESLGQLNPIESLGQWACMLQPLACSTEYASGSSLSALPLMCVLFQHHH